MINFELESVIPMSERPHPRAIARKLVKKKKKQESPFPIQQHASDEGPVDPRLEVDRILKESLRLTDKERETDEEEKK